jgi:pre-mRNA-processing factor 17
MQPNYLAIYDPKNKTATMKHNPTKAELLAPTAGPAHPHHAPSFMPHVGSAAHASGYIAPTNVAAWAFEEQYHTYNAYGYAIGTSGDVVGNAETFKKQGGDSVSTIKPVKRARADGSPSGSATAGEGGAAEDDAAVGGEDKDSAEPAAGALATEALLAKLPGSSGVGGVNKAAAAEKGGAVVVAAGNQKQKKKKGSSGDDAVMRAARAEAAREFDLQGDDGGEGGGRDAGPWAEYRDDDMELLNTLAAENSAKREAVAEAKAKSSDEFDVDHDLDRRDERKFSHLMPALHTKDTKPLEASSVWHGKAGTDKDYQGRSWVEAPKGVRGLEAEGDSVHDCYLPKKLIHRYTGHGKGVQCVRWFPDTGHVLMSASHDGKVKIWDAHNARSCKRTYVGHSMGVRDANFSHDGRHFLTASFDRYMRYWDTETGQCISTLTNRKVPYQARFHPTEHNVFVMASSDNRLWQWDLKTGETVQEYNHHLNQVNSVLFCDDGKRFVSTSDDKKILVWEWGIPVPMKYISDPTMHAIPTTGLHPWEQHFAAQSMENEIHVYGARDRFRRIRKKVFKGHTNAGFACQMTFSPNGKFMASGDGEGRMFVWDWKSCKQLRRFRCHDEGPLIDCQWHPLEPSWVATAGWDGVIKLWD